MFNCSVSTEVANYQIDALSFLRDNLRIGHHIFQFPLKSFPTSNHALT